MKPIVLVSAVLTLAILAVGVYLHNSALYLLAFLAALGTGALWARGARVRKGRA